MLVRISGQAQDTQDAVKEISNRSEDHLLFPGNQKCNLNLSRRMQSVLAAYDLRTSARYTGYSQGDEGDSNQKVAPPGNQTT